MKPAMFTNARAARAAILLAVLGVGATAGAAVSPGEERLLRALSAPRVLADLKRLAETVVNYHDGLGEGTAVSGSAEETRLATNIAATLRGLGLEVRIEEFPVRAYRYGPVTLVADGAPVPAISLQAAGGTWGRRDSVDYARGNEAAGHRLRAPLVDAGGGYAPDYDRIGDVRGKAVLVRREMRDWPPPQITEAAVRGAAAVIFYDHPSSGDQLDALRQDSMWAHEQLPTVAISIRSAQALQARLKAGRVEIALENRADVSDGRSRNVVATLRGTERPDEWVVVSGHFDRWFQGALDNTSGAAAVLEIARAFKQSGFRPRRSMLFVAVGSEEAGLEDPERDWLAGSHAFVMRHPEVMRSAALIFNVDGIGWTAPKATLTSTPEIMAHQRRLLADLGYAATIETKVPSGSSIDAWNYGVVGGAAMNHLWHPSPAFYPLYHTQFDVFRPERFENMEMDLRVLTLSLARAATEPRLPIALSALADYVDGQLEADAAKVADLPFADTRRALAEFRAVAAAVEAIDRPAAADGANRLLMATRHALAPWLYASNGDFEQVVRTGEYANRVSALDRALAAVAAGDRPAAGKILGELYEGRKCQQLSAAVYAYERGFWAGESGWASRFQHRAPPPPPAFEASCRALGRPESPATEISAGLAVARTDAAQATAQALALMAAKLRAATATLTEFVQAERHR